MSAVQNQYFSRLISHSIYDCYPNVTKYRLVEMKEIFERKSVNSFLFINFKICFGCSKDTV